MSSRFLEPVRELLVTADPPDLGPGPRAGVLSVRELNGRLEEIVARSGAESVRGRVELVRSLLLLWHDHLDASHELSQDIGSSDGSYLHGIMHRREPDYGNSKYWFRRVGDHPCFAVLAERAGEILAGSGLVDSLVLGGCWDPYAFVDACEAVEGQSDGDALLLRRVQAAEFEILLESFGD